MKYAPIYSLLTGLSDNLPRHLRIALSYDGLKEKPGTTNNPTIMKMAEEIGCARIYKADSMPWCALFVSAVLKQAGREVFTKDLYDNLRALSFLKWGVDVTETGGEIGDILVFRRKGGGHVGFYVGESKTHFLTFGGNQGDAVNIVALPKRDCVGIRRPAYNNKPSGVVKAIFDLADDGSVKLH